MQLTRITTAKRMGFGRSSLYKRKDHPKQTMLYMKQKSSFFIAAVSLTAFVAGNMVGEHGWYAFWKSVMGKYDDSLITYTGTVMPITLVPDYSRWSEYGGNPEEHTYKQVPKDILIPLKPYDPTKQSNPKTADPAYSVGYMGSYETDGDGHGSHPGVDIRVPIGTPVVSIANGIVTSVREDAGGFGKLVVIRHPHMPDPEHPDYTTVLHSSYSHLSSQLVSEGDIVQKGQQIGLSGMTGFASGPHLHFQIDRDTAPWHPYWPFTGAELRDAGLNTAKGVNTGFHQERGYEFTVQPMLVVQANRSAAKYDTAYDGSNAPVVKKPSTAVKSTKSVAQLRKERMSKRLASRTSATAVAVAIPTAPTAIQTIVSSVHTAAPSIPAQQPEVIPVQSESTDDVSSVDIAVPPTFAGREWLTVRITLLDANGNKTKAILKDKLYLRLAFGDAEFDKSVLTSADFTDGVALVKMLPRGTKTVIVNVEPMKVMSKPIKNAGE